ncbi:MAG: M23 family metallopeptidase [Gammaproteobacteria bacterium]|nr:M23 family metallopeptidase [Gammaproteobacteria bacterium]
MVPSRTWPFIVPLVLLACGLVFADTLYKYRGEDGEWIYTDRKPTADKNAEERELSNSFKTPRFTVRHDNAGTAINLVAQNEFFIPIEVRLTFRKIQGVAFPHPDAPLRWVVAPRSELQLLALNIVDGFAAPALDYDIEYVPGDPSAVHRPGGDYRAPFAAGTNYPITQAYPEAITHRSTDSIYAVDMAMPVGTDIFAARGGVVFDVASDNYRGGLNPARDGPAANVVRILHDDGTFAVYAHLNWHSIRVQPGDRVVDGEYIADSGNTGFSSGPHLHFAVQRNSGLRVDSLPVVFRGPDSAAVVPSSGNVLTSYP